MKKLISKIKKSCRNFITSKSGFSLVELIVVIAIMAVMAAVLAPALLGYVEKSRMQKDDTIMSEIVNGIKLSLVESDIYDEVIQASVKDNFSCYADGNAATNTAINKVIIKDFDLWHFNDQCRLLDETPYIPSGKMRGVTITFKPNGEAEYILKDGIINQMGNNSTKRGSLAGKTLEDVGFENLYNRLRSTVGDTIKVSSQTYRNSDYTIFISLGTTGGNQADKQDAIQAYGQYNGTNLSDVTPIDSTNGGQQDLLDLLVIDSTLANNTWDTIHKVVQSGKAAEYWSVGDTKTISINGTTRTVRIIGFNHDGENGITFMTTTDVTNRAMNTTKGNQGGWRDSEMRAWLNTDLLNSMIDTKEYIKPVNKTTNNVGYQGNEVSSTLDKIFLLSVHEANLSEKLIRWTGGYEYIDSIYKEGQPYEWFLDSQNNYLNTTACLRSVNANGDTFFFMFGYNGHILSNNAQVAYCVYPAFVIG